MTVLSAQRIREIRPIMPFVERTAENGLTYGLSACGYDIRIAESFLMWPQRFILASSIEYFHMPVNVCARVMDKSTWARQGITVQNTIIEPGWNGYLTLEIVNHSFSFRRIKAGQAIAQIVFELLDQATEMPYKGKYQNQEAGPQAARLIDRT